MKPRSSPASVAHSGLCHHWRHHRTHGLGTRGGSLIGLLVEQSGWPWLKAALAVGGGNLLLAFIFLLAMSKRLSSMRWFADTLNEFKKDRAWLARQTGKR
ncbi:phage holin family protein [Verrucomicrobium spinosum]|uniref:phage holin family protein n=1 Tax=Verrucomicrobium spinosum TaxID=2736 RepID=UPI0009461CDB|nr:phage holin family protein [Verrucomicrobium spinosum]